MSKTTKYFAKGNLRCGLKKEFHAGDAVPCDEKLGQQLLAEGAVTTDEKEALRLRQAHEEASKVVEADADDSEEDDGGDGDFEEAPSIADAGETQPGDEQPAKKPRGKKAAPVAAAPAAKKKPGKRGK